jgi:site-specific recombinase XerD
MRRHVKALINRRNWTVTREYLRYCSEVRQCCDGSVRLYRQGLDLLLGWARDVPLGACADLRPVFPRHLVERKLSVSYQQKVCAISRAFYGWARAKWPRKYRGASPEWVESLKRMRGAESICQREVYELDEVRALMAGSGRRLVDERDRACAAFLFLSGMRDEAFCTLPVKAVKIEPPTGTVRQWPALGVRTKGGKAANTFLLNAPDLLEVAQDWDRRLRRDVGEDGMWFARLESSGMRFAADQVPGANRSFSRRLKLLCGKAGISHRSPHKLRHGHAVWLMRRAKGMADLKAISQNLMHASISTTERNNGKGPGRYLPGPFPLFPTSIT